MLSRSIAHSPCHRHGRHQPAVIFVDEIDSLLCQRSGSDTDVSRRMKTEFFVQMDGAANGHEERLLLIGATNRPQELDDAARRRLVSALLYCAIRALTEVKKGETSVRPAARHKCSKGPHPALDEESQASPD